MRDAELDADEAAAATRIQAHSRGKLARQRVKRKHGNTAVTQIQAYSRGKVARMQTQARMQRGVLPGQRRANKLGGADALEQLKLHRRAGLPCDEVRLLSP